MAVRIDRRARITYASQVGNSNEWKKKERQRLHCWKVAGRVSLCLVALSLFHAACPSSLLPYLFSSPSLLLAHYFICHGLWCFPLQIFQYRERKLCRATSLRASQITVRQGVCSSCVCFQLPPCQSRHFKYLVLHIHFIFSYDEGTWSGCSGATHSQCL